MSDTNAGYDNIMKSVSNLKLQNMLLLDSGGSSQLSVNGKTIVASQDDRAVPDYIVMKLKIKEPLGSFILEIFQKGF